MRYMLMICLEDFSEQSVDPALVAASIAWVAEMDARGVRLAGSRLRPASDAITVARRDDEVLIADGPFAETKEQIGGYDLIECADLDEAIAIAAAHPVARIGRIEVRPLWAM